MRQEGLVKIQHDLLDARRVGIAVVQVVIEADVFVSLLPNAVQPFHERRVIVADLR